MASSFFGYTSAPSGEVSSSGTDQKEEELDRDVQTLLDKYCNRWGDVDIDLTELNKRKEGDELLKKIRDSATAEALLSSLLKHAKRGIWLSFSGVDDTEKFLTPALKAGYKFHHARDDFVRLRGWPHSDREDPAPPYAFTWYVSGAIVVNEEKEVLMIQQTYDNSNLWRPPGGCVDPGESAVEGAIREAKEETGIDVEFVCTLGSFEATGRDSLFGQTAVGVLSLFRPKYPHQPLNLQESEISACRWYPLDECLGEGFRIPPRMIPPFKLAKMLVENTDIFSKDSAALDLRGRIQESIKLNQRPNKETSLGLLSNGGDQAPQVAQLKTALIKDDEVKYPLYFTMPMAIVPEGSGYSVFDPFSDNVDTTARREKKTEQVASEDLPFISSVKQISLRSWAFYCGIFGTCAVILGYAFSR
eukprot:gb/GECG01008284.1/.p1 GENE.gb/GECG01008284.1/~~gb/GECG01008284.1/.p1  ORF type:complete len:417 (+),score=54.36 gb/GECG01008284.1/:1-1251(+)